MPEGLSSGRKWVSPREAMRLYEILRVFTSLWMRVNPQAIVWLSGEHWICWIIELALSGTPRIFMRSLRFSMCWSLKGNGKVVQNDTNDESRIISLSFFRISRFYLKIPIVNFRPLCGICFISIHSHSFSSHECFGWRNLIVQWNGSRKCWTKIRKVKMSKFAVKIDSF